MKKELNHSRFAIAIFFLPFFMVACSKVPSGKIATLEKAMNDHQIRNLLTLFTDDVSFQMGGYKGSGIREMKSIAEWDSVLHAAYSFDGLKLVDDTVFFKSKISNDLMNVMGFESGIADPVKVKFEDGLISFMSFNMTPEDRKRDQQIWSSFMLWARAERQEMLRELMPEGKFIVNGTTARGWLEAFLEWNTSAD